MFSAFAISAISTLAAAFAMTHVCTHARQQVVANKFRARWRLSAPDEGSGFVLGQPRLLLSTIQWTLDNPSWLDQEHFISTPGVGALAGAVMPAMKPGYNVDAAIVEGNAKVAAMAKL